MGNEQFQYFIGPTLARRVAVEDEHGMAGRAPGRVEQLAWLSGRWEFATQGQHLEETWSPATDDAMLGMFRWARDGSVWLYELMSIEQEQDTLVLRLRHFSRGLEPWASEAEGALEYPLKSLANGEAVFENPQRDAPRRFIYRREADRLTIRIEAAGDDAGPPDQFTFELADA